MSWIKDNKFAAMLGGVTLLVTIMLVYIGMSYRGRYSLALENYQSASQEVEAFEGIALYPSIANRAGKAKALNAYRSSITAMQAAFDKFRPKELKNITSQDFTDRAKAANEQVAKAFEKAGTKTPESFFLGFEAYSSGTLARDDATGLLNYQLEGTKELMLALAKAAPTQLQNIHRPKLPEEDGEKWQAGPSDAARPFPMEITFKGDENSLRSFVSSLANSPNFFFVVRSVRIANEKPKAPMTTDSKFEAPPTAPAAGRTDQDPFGGFVMPADEPPPADPPPVPRTTPGATPSRTPATSPAPARTPGATPARTPATPPRTPATPGASSSPEPYVPMLAPTRTPAAAATPTPARTPARTPAPAPAPTPPPAHADSSRILNQVLGKEELQVFLRIDILQFLPVKPLLEVPK